MISPFTVLFFFLYGAVAGLRIPVRPIKRREFWITAAAFVAGPLLLRGALPVVERLFFNDLPVALVEFDLQARAPLAVMWLLPVLTLIGRRKPAFLHYEIFVRLALLCLVSVGSAGFKTFFFANAFHLSVAVGVYCLVEFALRLALSFPVAESLKTRRKSYLKLALALVVVIGALIPLGHASVGSGLAKSGGGLLRAGLTNFDFAQSIQLENDISMGDRIILLLRAEKPLIDKTLYKRYALSGYDKKRGFFRLKNEEISTVPDYPVELDDPYAERRTTAFDEFFLLNLAPEALLSREYPARVTPYAGDAGSQFKRVYRVESRALPLAPVVVSTAPVAPLSDAERRLYLEYGDNEKIHALALDITRDLSDPYDKAMALQTYLKTGYRYSLRPGSAATSERLEHFLFVGKKGYCSYFAFAMALMARSLGLPARVASGFWVTPDLRFMDYYPIKAGQAHAWVQIKLQDYGWVDFDPTSDVPADGESPSLNLGSDSNQLYELISAATKARAALRPGEGAARLMTTPLPKAPGFTPTPAQKRAAGGALVALIVALYAALLFALDRRRRPRLADPPKLYARKTLNLISRLRFDRVDETALLNAYPEWAALLRRALFAETFSWREYQDLAESTERVKRARLLGVSALKRFGRILFPWSLPGGRKS